MANAILILGQSGTGKSYSIRNLDPSETFVINVIGKMLPFRDSRRLYRDMIDGKVGNHICTDNHSKIESLLNKINTDRKHIKNIILDDYQYLMCNEFLKRCLETGYGKFAEIGQHAFKPLDVIKNLRDDLNIFFMWHPTKEQDGSFKIKTVGRMIDDYIEVEGLFTHIFFAMYTDGEYKFLTNREDKYLAKNPPGIFEDKFIPNDLQFIIERMNDFYGIEKEVPKLEVVNG
jgi:hypothetical protein